MIHKTESRTQIELDVLGQYYASIINEKQSGAFRITARLKTDIKPLILQQAVNDLINRFPIFSGSLKRNFFWYELKLLNEPPKIIPIDSTLGFSNQYNKGTEHILKVYYGTRHFVVETNHTLCDGRTLTKITKTLLVRYFELLGMDVEKNDRMDFSSQSKEEIENAYQRFSNDKPSSSDSNNKALDDKAKVYHPPLVTSDDIQVITKKFSSSKIKALAKKHNATMSEYILSHILKAVAEERKSFGSQGKIAASIPIDCRSFFPSNTFRNFVSSRTIYMPETEDFSKIIDSVRSQFADIDKDYVHRDIYKLQQMYKNTRYVPRMLKDIFMNQMSSSESTRYTTGFSNVGFVHLPKEINDLVESLEFRIGLEENTPYYFSSVTVGDTLSFTATIRTENKNIMDSITKGLQQAVLNNN